MSSTELPDARSGGATPAAAGRRWASLAVVCALAFGAQHLARWRSDAQSGSRIAASAKPGDLRLVSSATCVHCTEARRWLDAHGVAYSECLIEHDPACAAIYSAAGAPGTPLVLVRNAAPQIGFSPERVARALQAR